MAKVLKLYNTFTRSLNNVELAGKLICANNINQPPIDGSLYICGPTVYDDCHVGHAITYIRADLFRRFMKSLFNIRLQTAMNITDIDDKILDRASSFDKSQNLSTEPSRHPFNTISEKYFTNFLRDLNLINVLPADIYVRVSKHIHLITEFIQKLERNGHVYITSNGDVYFKVNSMVNYIGRTDPRNPHQEEIHANRDSKIDNRDFVLWKSSKPNEPVWYYQSGLDKNKIIPGRPGWHVQCSAISTAIFGKKLDFHYGGKDLIFPHHYNEQACCCAYHQLDTSKTLNVWASHWLHSGHLVNKSSGDKMSKSLGNVVSIRNFVDRTSVNSLRLLCVANHYRSDITYDDNSLNRLKLIDHKLSAFNSYLEEELRLRQMSLGKYSVDEVDKDSEVDNQIELTQKKIIEGICDDMHLDEGLDCLLELSRYIYSKDISMFQTRSLMKVYTMLNEWFNSCGLSYGASEGNQYTDSSHILNLLIEFRSNVRAWALSKQTTTSDLLKECDNVRSKLDEIGFVLRDQKS